MTRAIIVPADVAGEALTDLKAWLAITTAPDEPALIQLLRASLDLCEGFTGILPLASTCEERLTATTCWQNLRTRPVHAITKLEALSVSGLRSLVDPAHYELDFEHNGRGRVRMLALPATSRIVVTFAAGLAPNWAALPEGLRHGILRLAAHNYRERDASSSTAQPPAAVTALWRPYRELRLA